MPISDQVKSICDNLRQLTEEHRVEEWHAIGISQGAQILRGVIQECDDHTITKFVSLGGQHEGVFGLPHCEPKSDEEGGMCRWIRNSIHFGAYLSMVQNHLVQAQYWRDPFRREEYETKCVWLPNANNHVVFNPDIRQQIARLKRLILVKFNQDQMVIPKESAHFEFYFEGQAEKIQPLKESPLYLEDRLGLRHLDSLGRLHLISVDGEHLEVKWDWFRDEILPLLRDE